MDGHCTMCNNKSKARYWIEYDECDRWFHCVCVGIRRVTASLLSWLCNECNSEERRASTRDVAVETERINTSFATSCVCNQYQNDVLSRERTVSECFRCKKWWHLHCIRMVEEDGSLLCPNCSKSMGFKLVNSSNVCIVDKRSTELQDISSPEHTCTSKDAFTFKDADFDSDSLPLTLKNHEINGKLCMGKSKDSAIKEISSISKFTPDKSACALRAERMARRMKLSLSFQKKFNTSSSQP